MCRKTIKLKKYSLDYKLPDLAIKKILTEFLNKIPKIIRLRA
jgi:hypothetical protein